MVRSGKKVFQVVDEKLGVVVDVRFHTDDGEFTAEFNGIQVKDKDAKVVEKEIRELIEEATKIEWTPVIYCTEVQQGHVYGAPSAAAGLTLERYWVTTMQNGDIRRARWDTFTDKKDDRLMAAEKVSWNNSEWGPFKIPTATKSRYYDTNIKYWLPYSEALWEGLDELLLRIRWVHDRLHEMLTSEVGLKVLSELKAGGPFLLPSFPESHD